MPAGTAGDWTNPRPREGTGETLQDLHRLEYKAAVEKKKKDTTWRTRKIPRWVSAGRGGSKVQNKVPNTQL